MADFASVLDALDQINGTHGLGRYLDQTRALAADSLSASPFVSRMMAALTEEFTGKASELLAEVDSGSDRPPKGWPANARAVTGVLRRNAPALRKLGWTVEDLGNNNRDKSTVWRLRPEIAGKSTPSDPHNPPSGLFGGETGNAGQESGQSQDECRIHGTAYKPDACHACAGLAA